MAKGPVESHRGSCESDPLLPSDASSTRISIASSPVNPRTRCTWPWLHVVVLAIVVAVVSDIGEDLLAAPKVRLFESALCAQYYKHHDPSLLPSHSTIPEHLCKINPIQDELAAILGGQLFFDSVPAIFFPIPYGTLADKYGRKWILVMSSVGFTLSYIWTLLAIGVLQLPLRWAWFSSAFFLLGGGPTIGTYLLTTLVADVVPPASRSTVFFYRFCTDLIADLAIPPLTSYLMSKNIWMPLVAAVLFQGLNSLMSTTLPETAPWLTSNDASEDVDAGPEAANTSTADDSSLSEDHGERPVRKVESSFSFVTRDKTIAALVFTFLISKIGRQSSNILFQYVSKRYDWTLSEAGLLLSLRAAVNLALFTIILPALAAFTLKRVGTSAIRDLYLTRGSIILLLFGTVVLFLSVTPVLMIIGVTLFTLGTGFAPTVRSLMTSMVEFRSTDETSSDIARLYALISVTEGIGSLVAALGMSWALRFGLSLGQQWLGLPFGFAAVLFGLVAIVVFSINTKHL